MNEKIILTQIDLVKFFSSAILTQIKLIKKKFYIILPNKIF
jgi:hypothetical protein